MMCHTFKVVEYRYGWHLPTIKSRWHSFDCCGLSEEIGEQFGDEVDELCFVLEEGVDNWVLHGMNILYSLCRIHIKIHFCNHSMAYT